jgi:hypothetical protein
MSLRHQRLGTTKTEEPAIGARMNLRWVQPRAHEHWYELRSGRQLLATLIWEPGHGSVAVAESGQSRWTFKQVGFHNRHVTVREAGTAANVAVYRPRWVGDGSVQFPDGRTYRWRSSDLRGSEWCFQDSSGHSLLSFRCELEQATLSALFRKQAHVEVHRSGQARPELPLLMLLGWYLLILRRQDARVAAGATVAIRGACAA